MKNLKSLFKILSINLIIIVSGHAFSQKKESIAVVSIDCSDILTEASAITNIVKMEIEKVNIYEVFDKYEVNEIIKKNELKVDDCYSKSCLINVGKTLNVDNVLTGSVARYGEKIVVTFRLINVKNETIVLSNVKEYINQEPEIQTMIRVSLRELHNLENDENIVNMLIKFDQPIISPKTTVRLNGTRVGLTCFTGESGKRLEAPKSEGGYNMFPITSMFGYQHEIQYLSAGDFQGLFEFLGTVNGLESGEVIPALTVMNGFRFNKGGYELAIGPSFRWIRTASGYFDENKTWHLEKEMPEGATYKIEEQIDKRGPIKFSSSLMVGFGKTFRSGYLNIPMNIYVSPRKEGTLYGFSLGFNVAKKKRH